MNRIFDIDRWEEIWSVLMRNKLRTFLTAFGVFWGIFMLVIMLGSGNGLQNGVSRGFQGQATNSIFMWSRNTSLPFDGLPRGRWYSFRNSDIEAAKLTIPELNQIAGRCQLGGWRGGNNVTRGKITAAFSIYGDYPVLQDISPVTVVSGRFLNNFDISEKRKICVIGSRVKETLFKPEENPIGQYIRINGVYFQIIGHFIPKSSNDREEVMNTIFIPFTTFQQTFNWGDKIGWLVAMSKDHVKASVVEEKLKQLIQKRHRIHPHDKSAVGSFNLEKEFEKFQGLFLGIRVLVWIVGIGTLFAGVIGVSNIMLIVVKERTKEIGIRRAIGATPSEIIGQIMLESILLTFAAGYLGLSAGVALLAGISTAIGEGSEESMFLNPSVDIGVGVVSLVILVVAGLFAGFIPAKRAISIPTVDALRTEL